MADSILHSPGRTAEPVDDRETATRQAMALRRLRNILGPFAWEEAPMGSADQLRPLNLAKLRETSDPYEPGVKASGRSAWCCPSATDSSPSVTRFLPAITSK